MSGVTSDLMKRVWEHRQDLVDGFTKEYGVHQLAYYEVHEEIGEAILREKRIKKWEREWKLRLIEQMNPGWKDLFETLTGKSRFRSAAKVGSGRPWIPAFAGMTDDQFGRIMNSEFPRKGSRRLQSAKNPAGLAHEAAWRGE